MFFDSNLNKFEGSSEFLKDAGNKIVKAINEVIFNCETMPHGLELSLTKVVPYGKDAATPDLGEIFLQGCNSVQLKSYDSDKDVFDAFAKDFKKFVEENFLCTQFEIVKKIISLYGESKVMTFSIVFSNEENYFEREDFDYNMPAIIGSLTFNIVQFNDMFGAVSVSCVIDTNAA